MILTSKGADYTALLLETVDEQRHCLMVEYVATPSNDQIARGVIAKFARKSPTPSRVRRA